MVISHVIQILALDQSVSILQTYQSDVTILRHLGVTVCVHTHKYNYYLDKENRKTTKCEMLRAYIYWISCNNSPYSLVVISPI